MTPLRFPKIAWKSVLVLCTVGLFLVQSLASSPVHAHDLTTAQPQGSCPQVPHNVNLSQLSDSQLAAYGLPLHHIMDANPNMWAKQLQHINVRTCPASESQSGGPSPQSPVPSPKYGCNPYPNGWCSYKYWAGWTAVTSNHQRGVYRQANIEFHVPTIPTSPSNGQVLIWAGVGGEGNVTYPNVLVQAGVNIYMQNGTQHNQTFWEVYPYFGTRNLSVAGLATGHLLFANVTSNQNNDGEDYFFIKDESNGNIASCYLSTGGPYNSCGPFGNRDYNSDSATGECIAEREPSVYPPLAEWNPSNNTLAVSNCQVNNLGINNSGTFFEEIGDDAGYLLAWPNDLGTNGTFTLTWNRGT
jgi:Peptidase A4 family